MIDFVLAFFFMAAAAFMWYHYARLGSFMTFLIATITIVLGMASYFSIQTFQGYPVFIPANKGEMHWAVIKEETNDKPGKIFLWLERSEEDENAIERFFKLDFKNQPRAYEIPYTEENKKSVREALESKMLGLEVELSESSDEPPPEGEEDEITQESIRFDIIDPSRIILKGK